MGFIDADELKYSEWRGDVHLTECKMHSPSVLYSARSASDHGSEEKWDKCVYLFRTRRFVMVMSTLAKVR